VVFDGYADDRRLDRPYTSSASSEWGKTCMTALTTAALRAIDAMPEPKVTDGSRRPGRVETVLMVRGSEGPCSGIAAERQKSEQPPGNDAQVIGVMWRGRALTCTSGLSQQHRSAEPADQAAGSASYRVLRDDGMSLVRPRSHLSNALFQE
jgi:hypothetical protein